MLYRRPRSIKDDLPGKLRLIIKGIGKLVLLPQMLKDWSSKTQDSAIHVHTYNLLLHIYDVKSAQKIKNITLTCLGKHHLNILELQYMSILNVNIGSSGFLFRAFPSLMTRRESINLMDNIFNNHNDGDLQHRLLKLIVESISNQIEQGQGDVESGKNDEIQLSICTEG
jgi:hypothetical protein